MTGRLFHCRACRSGRSCSRRCFHVRDIHRSHLTSYSVFYQQSYSGSSWARSENHCVRKRMLCLERRELFFGKFGVNRILQELHWFAELIERAHADLKRQLS